MQPHLNASFRDSLHNLVMYTFMQHLIQQDSRLKNNQTKGRKKLETSKEKRKKKHGKTSAFLQYTILTSLLVVVHRWPAVPTEAKTADGTTRLRSASSNTATKTLCNDFMDYINMKDFLECDSLQTQPQTRVTTCSWGNAGHGERDRFSTIRI